MGVLARAVGRLAKLWWRIAQPLTVGVRLILLKDGAVMLVKHTYGRHWYLPGGGVKKGESLEQAARREAAEELGATLGPLRLFGVYSNFFERKSDHVVVFACDEFTLAGPRDREIERAEFFRLKALPDDVSPGTHRRLDEFRQGAPPAAGAW